MRLNPFQTCGLKKRLVHLILGLAEQGKKDLKAAKEAFSKAEKINPRHVDAMMGLAEIAESEKDLVTLQNIQKKVNQLNTSLAEVISNKLDKIK
jgi:cytochrome c-type biogenesis protein CcmH/NrfG